MNAEMKSIWRKLVGIALFAEGLKRDIVARLRRGAGEPAA